MSVKVDGRTGKVLVFAADALQVFLAFIVGGLEAEEFGRVVAALLLRSIEFGGQIINLGLPFGDDLVEVLAALLHGGGQGLSALNFELHVFQLAGQTTLDLLQGDNLSVEGFDGFFSFAQASLQFPPIQSQTFKLDP